MYFEIFRNGNLIKRGDSCLNTLSWDNELMYVPSTDIVLPIEYREYLTGHEDFFIYVNNKVFPGTVVGLEEDKQEETTTVSLEHFVRKWQRRLVGVNIGVKDTIGNMYASDFLYPGWTIKLSDEAKDTLIDYVYSKQNYLDALTKTMELTPSLWWRVGFRREPEIEVSTFGDKKNVSISKRRSGPTNVSMVTDPVITYSFNDVVNLLSVYSDKGDGGMSTMTLREVFNNPSLQDPAFPVLIISSNVNNERDYSKYTDQSMTIAPNNEYEYAIMDTESVALEAGTIIEGAIDFNDLSPFTIDTNNEEVTDADRLEAAVTAYNAAIRSLKTTRRSIEYTFDTEQLPDINVGDKVRLLYSNELLINGMCSNYMKKIMTVDDWFYVNKISYNIEPDGTEVDTVTLSKTLKIDREVY